jgi:hypothetical protein
VDRTFKAILEEASALSERERWDLIDALVESIDPVLHQETTSLLAYVRDPEAYVRRIEGVERNTPSASESPS